MATRTETITSQHLISFLMNTLLVLVIVNSNVDGESNSTSSVESHLDNGYPICSLSSVGKAIDLTGKTLKTSVRCESVGSYPSVTLKLVSESGRVVGLSSGLANETIVATYEFNATDEDAGKMFTCHVIQGNITSATCRTGPVIIQSVYASESPQILASVLCSSDKPTELSKSFRIRWFVDDDEIKSSPSGRRQFEILAHGEILVISKTETPKMDDTDLVVKCEADVENGTSSSEIVIQRTHAGTASRPPVALYTGGALAGAFFGGVVFTVVCLVAVIVPYLTLTGNLMKTTGSLCCHVKERNKRADGEERKPEEVNDNLPTTGQGRNVDKNTETRSRDAEKKDNDYKYYENVTFKTEDENVYDEV